MGSHFECASVRVRECARACVSLPGPTERHALTGERLAGKSTEWHRVYVAQSSTD